MKNLSKIVVIADCHNHDSEKISYDSTDLDRTSTEQTQELLNSLKSTCELVESYSSIDSLFTDINKSKEILVFPYWYGERSRNRAALVPAACETAGFRFVGGDAYVRLICSDKALSKSFIKRAGLATPQSVLVENEQDLNLINLLNPPVIIKPNNENSSIGITENSLGKTKKEITEKAIKVKDRFGCSVLVEEFRKGRETFICIIGSKKSVDFIEFGERFVSNDESFFHDKIFGYELKKLRTVKSYVRCISNEVPADLFQKAIDCFNRLGTTEMLRIDGRFDKNEFHAIELTPSPLLTTTSDFLGTFLDAGHDLSDLMGAIVRNAWNSDEK